MTPVEPKTVPDQSVLVTFAKNQPEYLPLPAVVTMEGHVMTEWEPTEAELDYLLQGGRIRLTVWTFHQPLQPVMLDVLPPECGFRGE